MASNEEPQTLGPNAWFVEELAQNYKDNPKSVPENWRDLFSGAEAPTSTAATSMATATTIANPPAPATVDERAPDQNGLARPAPAPPAQTSVSSPEPPADVTGNGAPSGEPAPSELDQAAPKAEEPGQPLRGAAARIVTNMEASLGVPTATSFREVPAKLLEINRKVLNNHLKRIRGGKVSFTHLIGYAIVRAIREEVPAMASSYVVGSDGKPRVVRDGRINVGIAVDQAKSDGSRSLVVPVLKEAQDMGFKQFLDTYETAIAKVRNNKLQVDDLMGANVTITNRGTIGTVQSVPRLMPGQGLIVGLGGIGYPTEYQAADPATLADLGISKIMTVSSTYDHRIIQGAESGLFLKRVHELLLGEHDFYSDIFHDMAVPYEAVQWRKDAVATTNDVDLAHAKQHGVNTLINQYRVRG
ncbi:MAG: multifunctional oxoglutarate decarboxylase/oxoglutarate dehydrogenase thiamine pyrophosphate-binding subunit/dihydrolipoyllysine-residue succinyltransferase subunit, partial [Acidimicrobiales bacterium]|nr:multifunctional oxoglutarate decarboxylase/oxoglutarate dehydrogenase thiamine pyrophosphate-binding subunit/dihydrolipoyllysine-residue succinyltransferase subunit [Acidimicrobiales bacterium]